MSSTNGTSVVKFIRDAADAGADGPPDAELVRRFAAHSDEHAFRVLVSRHAPVVWTVCRRMLRNHHDAEDAFQATFLVFARSARGIRNENAVGGWLCGVAGRVAARVRQRSRPEPASVPVDPATGHPDGMLGDLTVREAEAILYEELTRLPERYRDAVVLCGLEGLTRDEAAARLGWTENQVKHCLEHGRERLRSRLARRGVALGVPLLTTFLAPVAGAAPPVLATVPTAAISSLASGVTQTMWIAKWKWAAIGCVTVVLVAGGTFAAHHVSEPDAPPAKPALALVPVATAPEPPMRAPAAEPKEEQPKPAWEVATAYLQFVIDGKPEQARKLGEKLNERYIREIQTAGLTRVKLALVLLNDSRAMVVTAREKLKRRPDAEPTDEHVLVTLERKDAGWRVRDSDVADEKTVLRESEDYLDGKFIDPPNDNPKGGQAGDPLPVLRVADEFLQLAQAEKDADAVKLTVPGTISENKVGEIRKAGVTSMRFVAVFLNDNRAEAVTSRQPLALKERQKELGHLVIMLTKSKDGTWRVKDIDFRDGKGIEARAKLYLAGAYDEKAAKP